MKGLKYMNEEEAIRKAVDVLIREMGPVDAIRFINIPKKRRMESVKRHREWQKTLNKDKFFDEVFAK
jgi:phosphoketolase